MRGIEAGPRYDTGNQPRTTPWPVVVGRLASFQVIAVHDMPRLMNCIHYGGWPPAQGTDKTEQLLGFFGSLQEDQLEGKAPRVQVPTKVQKTSTRTPSLATHAFNLWKPSAGMRGLRHGSHHQKAFATMGHSFRPPSMLRDERVGNFGMPNHLKVAKICQTSTDINTPHGSVWCKYP